MKSIMEEASSIMKAIENGWIRAGKPQEFSVKIFEQPEKSFFGFTTKQAKIGIFTTHTPSASKGTASSSHRDTRTRPTASNAPAAKHPHQPSPQSRQQQNAAEHASPAPQPRRNAAHVNGWSEELSSFAQDWLSHCLRYMEVQNPKVSVEVAQEVLELHIQEPLSDSSENQRTLFKSLSHLAMEALRNKFKQSFRSLRIIICVK